MKERKLTINIVWANMFSIILFVVVLIITSLLWKKIWEYSYFFQFQVLSDDKLSTWYFIAFLIIFIGGIVVHELIHGLTWAHYAKSGWKSINFGVMWKMITPYCHCNEPLHVREYTIGALMPLLILGIIPLVVGTCIGSSFTTIFGVLLVAAAGGDILVAWKLRHEKADNMVLDHPTEAGCIIYEKEETSQNNY